MKRLFYLMLVVLGTAAFTACSDDDDNNNGGGSNNSEGVITFMAEIDDLEINIYTLHEKDIITIDWGDGITEKYISYFHNDKYDVGEVTDYKVTPKHVYSDNKTTHTVTIKGNISGLESEDDLLMLDINDCSTLTFLCFDNCATSLDISKHPALTYFAGSIMGTSLNLSNCPKLTEVYCEGGNLTSLNISGCTALTYLGCVYNQFTAAEMNKIYEALPVIEHGTLYCDKLGDPSIAEQKGWNVF